MSEDRFAFGKPCASAKAPAARGWRPKEDGRPKKELKTFDTLIKWYIFKTSSIISSDHISFVLWVLGIFNSRGLHKT
jgi:hypothetical protein